MSTINFAAAVASWPAHVSDVVRILLAEPEANKDAKDDKGKGKEKEDQNPENQPTAMSPTLYMLQQVQPSQQLVKVLKSKETLEKCNLGRWVVNDSILLNCFSKI